MAKSHQLQVRYELEQRYPQYKKNKAQDDLAKQIYNALNIKPKKDNVLNIISTPHDTGHLLATSWAALALCHTKHYDTASIAVAHDSDLDTLATTILPKMKRALKETAYPLTYGMGVTVDEMLTIQHAGDTHWDDTEKQLRIALGVRLTDLPQLGELPHIALGKNLVAYDGIDPINPDGINARILSTSDPRGRCCTFLVSYPQKLKLAQITSLLGKLQKGSELGGWVVADHPSAIEVLTARLDRSVWTVGSYDELMAKVKRGQLYDKLAIGTLPDDIFARANMVLDLKEAIYALTPNNDRLDVMVLDNEAATTHKQLLASTLPEGGLVVVSP